MTKRKIVAGTAGLALMAAGGTAAVSASGSGSAESSATNLAVVKQKHPFKFKANRYIQDGLRFDKDTYEVNSGGTLRVVNNKASEGPHTVSIVQEKGPARGTSARSSTAGRATGCSRLTAPIRTTRGRPGSNSSRTARARISRRISTGLATPA